VATNYVLRPAQIVAARIERHEQKTEVRTLAKKYKVSHTSMSRLLRGVTYPNLEGPLDPGSQRKLTRQEVVAARHLRHDFETPITDLARMYDVNRSSMRRILCGISYRNVGGPIEPGYGARLGERDSQEKRD
jgi:DNA-binding MarR family transcriptional regulator